MNRIEIIEKKLKALVCSLSKGDYIEKPDGVPEGWVAVVNAAGTDVEWVPPVAGNASELLTLVGGQSVYTLAEPPVNPLSTVVIYDNHALMYGTGYTISGTQLTFLTNNDWSIESGEIMHIVYDA